MDDRVKRLQQKLGKIFRVLKEKKAHPRLYRKNVDKFFSAVSNFMKEEVGAGSVCCANCAQCCYRAIFIYSRTEEAYVMRALDALGPAKKKEIVPRILETWEKWEQTCSDLAMDPKSPAFPPDVEILWMEDKIPCPLLEVTEDATDGLCLIYPRMPIECRLVRKLGEPCLGPEDAGIALMTNSAQIAKETIDMCHKIDEWHEQSYTQQVSFLEVLRRWTTM